MSFVLLALLVGILLASCVALQVGLDKLYIGMVLSGHISIRTGVYLSVVTNGFLMAVFGMAFFLLMISAR